MLQQINKQGGERIWTTPGMTALLSGMNLIRKV